MQQSPFNHYAYGAVGEWLYRYVAGIDLGPVDEAFHHFDLHPQFDRTLGAGGATYESAYGTIVSSWKYASDAVAWTTTIPANTTATISFPVARRDQIMLNGRAIPDEMPGLRSAPSTDGHQSFEAAAGSYRFTIHPDASTAVARDR